MLKLKRNIVQVVNQLPFKNHLFPLLRNVPISSKWKNYLYWQGLFSTPINETQQLWLYHPGYASHQHFLYWHDFWERHDSYSLQIWTHFVKTSTIIFDVGANVGIYSLLATLINPHAKIYSFEPVLQTFQQLANHIDLNHFSNIIPFQVAVGATTQPVEIYYHADNLQVASRSRGDKGRVEIVQQITLDEFADQQNLDTIDVIKIDVESYELEVLQGMQNILETMRPMIMVEVLSDELGNHIENFMQDKKYTYYLINQDEKIIQKQPSIQRHSTHARDYVLCPTEKIQWVEAFIKKEQAKR